MLASEKTLAAISTAIASILGRNPALGAAASSASSPVTLATDQATTTAPLYVRLTDGTSALLATAAHVLRVANYDKTTVQVDLLATGNEKTSPATATYALSTAVTGLSVYSTITIHADLIGGTGGVLDIVLETSPDGGTTWYEYVRFATMSAAATASYAYDPVLDGSIVAVGKGLTTTFVLAAGTARNGHWGDRMRVRMVAGSGTSAGAIQSIKLYGVRDTA